MNIKKLLMASTLLAGVTGLANVADASELNSVDTIKAEMHKQQGNQQHLAVYRVQKGDTLSGIAETSGLTIHQILEMNDIPNPNLIYVGQLINLGYGNQAQQFVAKQGQSIEKMQKNIKLQLLKKHKMWWIKQKEIVLPLIRVLLINQSHLQVFMVVYLMDKQVKVQYQMEVVKRLPKEINK